MALGDYVKSIKIVGTVMLAYLGLVVVFESYLGIVQPRFGADNPGGWDATIVITTTSEEGVALDRVVVPLETEGRLYVSANHWPRSWYKRALENSAVRVTSGGETKDYTAVPVPASGEEHDRLEREHSHPVWFRFMTGFPPRLFLRLEPR
jgi:hypothetical protein